MIDNTDPASKISLRHRFLSGASWALSGKILSAGATLVANALLARLLSPEDLGSYFLALSVVAIFSTVCIWGLNRGLVKMIAAELAIGRPELARSGTITAFTLVFIISTLIALILLSPLGKWALAVGFNSKILASLSMILGLWIFVRALQGLVSESFRGFHDIRLATVFGGLVTAVISMLLYLMLWIFQGTASLDQAIFLMILASSISLFAGLFLLFRIVRVLKKGANSPVMTILRFGFPLMVTSLAMLSVREFHLWILAAVQPKAEVALYGSTLYLVTLLALPLTIINAVIPPMVADLYSTQHYTRLQNLLQKTATLMSLPAFIVFGLILIFGADALALVYGDSYRIAYIPFVILAVGQFINVLTGSPGILLTMSGHERVVMRSALGAGVIGLMVTFFGAQAYGATGAAIGFSAGIVLMNTSMWGYAYWRMSIRTHGSPSVAIAMLRDMLARAQSK